MQNFITGLLHDKVINSYFSAMCKTQGKVLYYETTEALLISHGKYNCRLWKNQPIQKNSVIIIPFNSTGYRRIFIQIDLCNRHYCIIHPFKDDIDEDSKKLVKVLFIIKCISLKKFGLELNFFNFNFNFKKLIILCKMILSVVGL